MRMEGGGSDRETESHWLAEKPYKHLMIFSIIYIILYCVCACGFIQMLVQREIKM